MAIAVLINYQEMGFKFIWVQNETIKAFGALVGFLFHFVCVSIGDNSKQYETVKVRNGQGREYVLEKRSSPFLFSLSLRVTFNFLPDSLTSFGRVKGILTMRNSLG